MARIQFFLNLLILFAIAAWAIPSPVYPQAGNDDMNAADVKVASTGYFSKRDVITHPHPKPFPKDVLTLRSTGDDPDQAKKDKKGKNDDKKKPSWRPQIVIGGKNKKNDTDKAKEKAKKLKGNSYY